MPGLLSSADPSSFDKESVALKPSVALVMFGGRSKNLTSGHWLLGSLALTTRCPFGVGNLGLFADRSPSEGLTDLLCSGRRVGYHLKIPNADDLPTHIPEVPVCGSVAINIALDLSIPELAALSSLELARVSMPERAIDEHGNLGSAECDVWRSWEVSPVAAPSAEPDSPQCLAECEFGCRVSVSDTRHDLAALLSCEHVWHGQFRMLARSDGTVTIL